MPTFYEEHSENAQPEDQTLLQKLHLFVYDRWKSLLIGGISQICIITSVVLLTYFLARQPTCEAVFATSSTSTLQTMTTSDSLSSHTKPDTTIISTRTLPISSTMPTHASDNVTCAVGFTYVNKKCWKLITGPQRRADADEACMNLGGSTLFSIRSDIENRALVDFVKDKRIENLWTGLICVGKNSFSCTWDVNSGTAAVYNNFAEGYPNNVYGDCIHYMTTGTQAGQWASGSCNETMSFVCELPATIYDDTCDYNYDRYCYTPHYFIKHSSEAQQFCAGLCSNSVSIHSGNENRFVLTLYLYTNSSILIGGIAPSYDFVLWYDGTQTTYNNIDSIANGNCLYLNDLNTRGNWFGLNCLTSRSWFICKRRIGENC
ncbi:C-type lectin domain-containing protein [Caenorhabditis elegans]|uniref:C-type lectin domain-containing protein n=1 Tax=Caenorhabditis elegans TaxID=6239 RepID=O45823_CAEEL|nr:C-type lectin domain-containing protein [Caenorhabditis elegans]CAB04827.2 C-type lectin domain-containing protein [Caenorhabditis elegans]|eukprot:NP_507235.2 C-type LECtin [Caenorhabditis elegans]